MKFTKTRKVLVVFILITASFRVAVAINTNTPKKDRLKTLHYQLYNAKQDSIKIMLLDSIAEYYWYKSADSSLLNAKLAYNLSQSSNKCVLWATMNLACAYEMINDYEHAITLNLQALEYVQKTNDKKRLSNRYTYVGWDYDMLDKKDKAIEYFQKALDVALDDEDRYFPSFFIAQAYFVLKKFKKSHEYYDKALELARKNKDNRNIKRNLPAAYFGLGELYFEEKIYNKSLDSYEKALSLSDSADYYHKTEALYGIAKNYLQTGKYEKGLQIAQQANFYTQNGGFIDWLRDVNLLLSQFCDSMRQPAQSLSYYKKYVLYKDSIFNKEKSKRIEFLQAKFEAKQREVQIENLRKEVAFERKLKYLYFIIGFFVLVILFFFIITIRIRNKKLKIENELVAQKLQIEKNKMEQQKEKERLEKEKLALVLDGKHREILTHTLQINQQKEILVKVKSEIVGIIKLEDSLELINSVKQLASEIDSRINLCDDWQQIKLHFEKVHPNFFKQLENDFPDLSALELKLCAYTKLKFTTKDIGRLLNINAKSVQMARYRLKKKLNIPDEVSFADFICERN